MAIENPNVAFLSPVVCCDGYECTWPLSGLNAFVALYACFLLSVEWTVKLVWDVFGCVSPSGHRRTISMGPSRVSILYSEIGYLSKQQNFTGLFQFWRNLSSAEKSVISMIIERHGRSTVIRSSRLFRSTTAVSYHPESGIGEIMTCSSASCGVSQIGFYTPF
jgi:hypothetical protein